MINECRIRNESEINIKWLMNEAAESITKALRAVISDEKKKDIYNFHLKFTVKKRLFKLRSPKLQKKTLRSITHIHLSASTEKFSLPISFFINKLQSYNNSKKFVIY